MMKCGTILKSDKVRHKSRSKVCALQVRSEIKFTRKLTSGHALKSTAVKWPAVDHEPATYFSLIK